MNATTAREIVAQDLRSHGMTDAVPADVDQILRETQLRPEQLPGMARDFGTAPRTIEAYEFLFSNWC